MGTRSLIVFSYKQVYYTFYNQFDSYKEYLGTLLVLFLQYYSKDIVNMLEKSGITQDKISIIFDQKVIDNYTKVLEELVTEGYVQKTKKPTFGDIFLNESNLFNNLIFRKLSENLCNEEIVIINSHIELKNCIIECNFDYYYNIDLNDLTFNFYKIITNWNPIEIILKDHDRTVYRVLNTNGKLSSSKHLQLKFKSDIKVISDKWRTYEKTWETD